MGKKYGKVPLTITSESSIKETVDLSSSSFFPAFDSNLSVECTRALGLESWLHLFTMCVTWSRSLNLPWTCFLTYKMRITPVRHTVAVD